MVIYDINNDLKKILVGISIFIKSLRYSNFLKILLSIIVGLDFLSISTMMRGFVFVVIFRLNVYKL